MCDYIFICGRAGKFFLFRYWIWLFIGVLGKIWKVLDVFREIVFGKYLVVVVNINNLLLMDGRGVLEIGMLSWIIGWWWDGKW